MNEVIKIRKQLIIYNYTIQIRCNKLIFIN